jgi:hypothetical protein
MSKVSFYSPRLRDQDRRDSVSKVYLKVLRAREIDELPYLR